MNFFITSKKCLPSVRNFSEIFMSYFFSHNSKLYYPHLMIIQIESQED